MIGKNTSIGVGVIANAKKSTGSSIEYKEFKVAGAPQSVFELDNTASKVIVDVDRVPQYLIDNDYAFDDDKTITLSEAAPIGSTVSIKGIL